MSQPNPFAAPVNEPQQQAAAQPNPFGSAVASEPAVAQPSPFGQQQAVQAYQPPAPVQPAVGPESYGYPAQQAQQQYAQPTAYQPPAQVFGQTPQPSSMPSPHRTAPPMLDPSAVAAAAPPVVGNGRGPDLPDMYGRLVLVFPQSITNVPRNPRFITPEQAAKGNTHEDRVTATFVVLDSGPGTPAGQGSIQWGGKPHEIPSTPHTENTPLPCVVAGKWVSQSRLVGQFRDFLPQAPGAAPGMVVGRLAKTGPERNAPWYLVGANEQEIAIARQYLAAVGAGHLPHPLA